MFIAPGDQVTAYVYKVLRPPGPFVSMPVATSMPRDQGGGRRPQAWKHSRTRWCEKEVRAAAETREGPSAPDGVLSSGPLDERW